MIYVAVAAEASTTLEQLLGGGSKLPYDDVLNILSDVAGALDYLHGFGRRHGDLKPSHVLIADDGRSAALIGCGLAETLREEPDVADAWRSSSPGYHPHALWHSRGKLGDVDQFALAVMAYEMLAGKRRAVFDPALRMHILEPFAIPMGIPIRAEASLATNALLNRLLTPGGGRQFATCAELVKALIGEPPRHRPEGWGGRMLRLIPRRAEMMRLVIVLLVVGLGLTLVLRPSAREQLWRAVATPVTAVAVRLGFVPAASASESGGTEAVGGAPADTASTP